MYEIFNYISENFETIVTIFGSVVVGASAACALIPGGGLVKKVLAVLALNIRNATPEQIAKAKALVDAGKELTKPEKKDK
mgnify:CR=1 FL=1|jgi:hypothetical protein